ncbi:MAG TPA: ZIP family metal transporter [Polyangiaceae bacterium]
MNRVWLFTGLAIIADGLAGLAGGLLSDRWLRRYECALVGLAAGALLAAAFLEVLPQAVAVYGPAALRWSFAGFVAFAIIEWLAGHHHRKEALPSSLPGGLLFADALHNIGDGAVVAAAFSIAPSVGLGVALAVIAHELPQEIGDYALLRAAGLTRGRALFALAAVQLTAALGAAGVILASRRIEHLTALVLSVTAGTFLYIAATDLLPEIHSGKTPRERRERMLGFLAGVALIALASIV